MIIDHLHDDIVSLTACNLVCKTWTRSARFHLFSELTLGHGGRDVKQLLRSAAVVIPFVRHLRLRHQKWEKTLPLLVGFKSIRSLAVTDSPGHPGCLGDLAMSTLFCNFSAAVDVRLENVRFLTAGCLIRFICTFPRLERLAIHCNGTSLYEVGVWWPTPTFDLSPHLRVLELDDICMDAVLDWFLSLPDRPALRAVGLHPDCKNNSEIVTKLLTALENSLESFLISTLISDGMFVIFLSLIYAACQVRIALANRPMPQHILTLPSNRVQP